MESAALGEQFQEEFPAGNREDGGGAVIPLLGRVAGNVNANNTGNAWHLLIERSGQPNPLGNNSETRRLSRLVTLPAPGRKPRRGGAIHSNIVASLASTSSMIAPGTLSRFLPPRAARSSARG